MGSKKKANKLPVKAASKGGQPTKYLPEYCAKLIEHMGAQGLSYESFAAVVKVNVDTLYNWEGLFVEFSEAKKVAVSQNLLFWEQIGLAGMAGKMPGFVPAIWIFNMKNRHRWRDRIETENKTTLDGNLNVNLNANVVNLIEQIESGQDPEDC